MSDAAADGSARVEMVSLTGVGVTRLEECQLGKLTSGSATPYRETTCEGQVRHSRREPRTTVSSDNALGEVVSAWPELPPAIKAGIQAMVRSVVSERIRAARRAAES